MSDLFGDLAPPVRRPERTPPPREPCAEPKQTCRRVELDSGLLDKKGVRIVAEVYVHPCGICGADHAPFGSNVFLLRAIKTGNRQQSGTWLCGQCREAGK